MYPSASAAGQDASLETSEATSSASSVVAPSSAWSAGSELCVLAGDETLRLPLHLIRAVLRPPVLTRMPHAPAAMLGLCNLRGAVLPVLSLRVLRGGEGASKGGNGSAARVVVVEFRSGRVGLLVEAVLPSGTGGGEPIEPDTLLPAAFAPAPRAPSGRADAVSATPRDEPDAAAGPVALLGFRVGASEFALPLDAVLSVSALGTIASAERTPRAVPGKVPGTDAAMLGVVTARGALLPVLDAATLLGLPRRGTGGARLVVARIDDRAAGLAVDALTGILRLPAAAIEPVPPLLMRGMTGEARIEGLCRLENGRRLVQLLHPGRLLDAATKKRLADTVEASARAATGDAACGKPTAQPAEELFLLVQLGRERFGLPIAAVGEVTRHPDRLSRLPGAPCFMSGVSSLRGRVLPVLDGGQCLAGHAAAPRRHIVVMRIGTQALGLAVDSARELARFAAGSIAPAHGSTAANALFDRVATMADGVPVLLVDPAALLDGSRREKVPLEARA